MALMPAVEDMASWLDLPSSLAPIARAGPSIIRAHLQLEQGCVETLCPGYGRSTSRLKAAQIAATFNALGSV
jgi:hypothetical protein